MATARSLRLLSLAVLLIGVGVACGDDDDGADGAGGEIATIEAGTLTVCTDSPYPPFEFEEDGEFTGFDIELIRTIARNLDLGLTPTVQPFDEIWLAPAANTCDLVASALAITPERQAAALFSDPYFDADQSLLVRAEEADQYPDLAATDGRTIGVQSGTGGADYAREHAPGGATVKEFDGPAAMFLALRSKEVDALLQDFPANLDRANSDDQFAVVAEFRTGEQYGFATSTDRAALMAAVNSELAALRATGEYDEIFGRWFPTGGD